MTVVSYRPFRTEIDLSWWQKINIPWWLQRIPLALLTIPAAYGVSSFASEKMIHPYDWVAGIAFEAAYIGAIALADQQHDIEDTWTTVLWVLVNLIAVISSALMNTLFFADGKYIEITPEAATHGIPFAVLNLVYALYLHRISVKQQERDLKKRKLEDQWRDDQARVAHAKTEAQLARLEVQIRKVREIPGESTTLHVQNVERRSETGEGTSSARAWTCITCNYPFGNRQKFARACKAPGCPSCGNHPKTGASFDEIGS